MQATHQTTKARYLALAAALTLLLNSGVAQTAAPKTSDPSGNTDNDEAAIVLSPFVVDATKDQGYTATSTLAGSRINTELKDVAASITVVTSQFLKDVNAVDINDILTYTAGTEGTGDFTKTSDSLGRPSDDVSRNSNTSNRIRGLKAADTMRDYFYTIATWVGLDSYNLDTVTINRGPNSVLAGLGSAAGIINYSLQMANLNKNTNQVTYRFGSYSDQRATFNTNYVAKKNVLAFRVAGAWSDKGFKQQPSWNKDKRIFGVVTYQPWKKTTIRLSHERVKIDSNNPNTITPEDAVSQWVALGKPVYDSSSTAPVSNRLTANGSFVNVVYNKSGAIEGAFNQLGRPATFQDPTATFYQQNLGNTALWTAQRMNGNEYFQLDSVNLSPSLADLKFNATNLSIDQQIIPGMYLNLSYVKEKIKNDRLDLFRAEYMTYNIDVNVKMPDGSANPHYGETYMFYRGLDNKQLDDNDNRVLRGTLTYDLDLTKKNKWLGHHKVTAFAEDRKSETLHTQYDTWSNTGSTNGLEIGYRYYLGGTATTPATALPQRPSPVSNVSNRYFDTVSGTYKNDTLSSFYKIKSETGTLEKLGSQAFVMQSYFWEDRIVGLFGIRHDKDQRNFRSGIGVFAPAFLASGNSTLSNTTKTYGVVVHPLKWLSFHYNHGENWEPNSGAVDLLGNTTPFPNGVSKDYGVSLRLMDEKLNVKLNWFETSANDAASVSANFPLAQWTIPWMDLTVMPDIAARAGITNYKKGMAPGLVTGDPRLANAYTEAAKSKGIELELTYNVTKDWRIMANVSKQEASASGIAPGLTAFIEERLAYWKSIPALWTGTLSSPTLGWGNNRTGEQQWNADNLPYYIAYKANDGKPSPQLAKWHASVLTNYSFSDGALKGFSIGGGARYIEKAVIGNPAILSSTGAVTGLDLANPYTTPSRIAVDLWAGYKTKICDGRYDLSFQFNVKDLQEGGSFRPINANGGDGRHSVFRIVQPRTFFLTTTVEF